MRLLQRKAGLSPQYSITDRSKAMLLLLFILIVNDRPLSVCIYLLFNLYRIALWPSVGKELSPWLFTCAVFYFSAVLIVGVSFLVWCSGQDVEFDCIGS